MARRLRFNGTGSGGTGCPSLHEDLESREVIVHGPPLSDPEDVAQLHHLSEGEVAVVVPRELLVDYAPRDVTRAARIIDLDEFENLFRTFKHTAWRLETRRRYASDEITDTYRQFAETGSVDWDLEDPYCAMIRAQTEQGKRVERVRIADDPTTRRPADPRPALPPRQREAEHRHRRGHQKSAEGRRGTARPAGRGLLDLRLANRGMVELRPRRSTRGRRTHHGAGRSGALLPDP
ncbi:hypothetical protein EES42_40810 [Streptomyces sp. ADI95-17]|nr:hypothetical protein EES42_40810 [Streptomyces sp. ADI95-17]